MKFTIPKDNYSTEDREIIQSEYNKYLNELQDSKKVHEFINSRIRYTDEFLEFQNKCLSAFKITSFNVIVAILSLTVLKDCEWYLFLLLIWPLFFIPAIYFSLIDYLLEKIFSNKIKHQNYEKDSLRKLYEKNVYEKYEKYVKKYEEIIEYDNKVNKIKSDIKQAILEKIYTLDDIQFRNTLKMLYSNRVTIKDSKQKNCLEAESNNSKHLIMYKKMKRSISIADVKKFEDSIVKDNFDYGIIYYIGDISTPAVKYCSRNLRKKIFLFNHYDLCNIIYDYIINNSTN